MSDRIHSLMKNKHFKFGVPFVLMVVGSSFALKEYSQIKFDIQKEKKIITKTQELRKLAGVTKQITIEEEYENYMKTQDIDNWKNIRGPRPWEADNPEYSEMMEKRAKQSKDEWVFDKK